MIWFSLSARERRCGIFSSSDSHLITVVTPDYIELFGLKKCARFPVRRPDSNNFQSRGADLCSVRPLQVTMKFTESKKSVVYVLAFVLTWGYFSYMKWEVRLHESLSDFTDISASNGTIWVEADMPERDRLWFTCVPESSCESDLKRFNGKYAALRG